MNRRSRKGISVSLITLTPFVLCRCAGPATPLGGVWEASLPSSDASAETSAEVVNRKPANGAPQIHFDPPRQVLHGPKPLTVVVDDPVGIDSEYTLKVRYNGIDVTRSFMRQAKIETEEGGRRLRIQIPVVRLAPTREHRIQMLFTTRYGTAAASRVVAEYRPPECRLFDLAKVERTEGFEPEQFLLRSIDRISKQSGFSPAFTSALVAQESSFNPKTVSWAGAVGLTQVTPVAETEIQDLVSQWPQYPGIAQLPAPLIKFLVAGGEINERNEWRLQPERSIRGGLSFLRLLSERWSSAENMARILAVAGGSKADVEALQAKLILASYNSGFTRVQTALLRDGAAWLKAPELQEARKYVNRIFSFCDSFSQPEVDYENEA